jgi:hypothetical protein
MAHTHNTDKPLHTNLNQSRKQVMSVPIHIHNHGNGDAHKVLILTAGYKRHGKDTFGQGVQNHNVDERWVIWGAPQAAPLVLPDATVLVAFAAALKKETIEFLQLPGSWQQYEHVKDTLRVAHPDNSDDIRLLRDWYIWWGAEQRKKDVNIWCARALGHLTEEPQDTVVTDWRFLNESGYSNTVNTDMHIQTVRVFREEAAIPDKSITSEHELDHVMTDYVALPPGVHQMEALLKLFPQYKDYQVVGHCTA